MNITLKKVKYFKDKAFQSGDFSFEISPTVSSFSNSGGIVSNLNNCFVFPAFCDVHVHLREPGFSYKETVTSGTKAAARGGYTAVFSMPNLNPVPDSVENMKIQKSLIENGAVIKVYPYASITVGQKGEALSDFENLMLPAKIGKTANKAIPAAKKSSGIPIKKPKKSIKTYITQR